MHTLASMSELFCFIQYFMERFLVLFPSNLYSLFNEFRYKIVVYPIMITYFIDKDKKYDESSINKKIKKLSKEFAEFISSIEENSKLQTTILDFFKKEIGPELRLLEIGISCNRLFKSKIPYYRNFERINSVPATSNYKNQTSCNDIECRMIY